LIVLLGSLFGRKESLKDVHLKVNLHEWDAYLNKKTWSLRQSYVNAIVNFQRGIAIENEDFNDELKVIQLFSYEFYIEILDNSLGSLHKFFLSVRSILTHRYELELDEW